MPLEIASASVFGHIFCSAAFKCRPKAFILGNGGVRKVGPCMTPLMHNTLPDEPDESQMLMLGPSPEKWFQLSIKDLDITLIR